MTDRPTGDASRDQFHIPSDPAFDRSPDVSVDRSAGSASGEAPEKEPGTGATGTSGATGFTASGGSVHGTDTVEEAAQESAAEKEWWDNPGMPWKQKPTRSDLWCMGWIGFMGVFGLALLPFRAWMLARSPWTLVSLTGSRSGTAALGALTRTGGGHLWWLALLFGSLMSVKFDWVYWWAGKLWGRGMIEVWAGQSQRSLRSYARAERWAQRFGWLGMFVAYIPIPLPLMQVIFVLAGAEGWSLKKFLGLDFLASTIWLGCYFLLGWFVGAPAVDLLKLYARVAQYVAIALVVVVVAMTLLRGRTRRAA